MSNRLEGLVCSGAATFGGAVYLPAETITNANIQTGANVTASKLEHVHRKTYSQIGSAVDVAAYVIHVVNGATARNLYVRAGSIAAAIGDATVTIDIKKNGTSVMTGATPLTLNSSNTAYVPVELSIATTTAVVGNVYTLVIDATIGTGTLPTGLFVEFEIDEVYTT
jgi:hypothetical protein